MSHDTPASAVSSDQARCDSSQGAPAESSSEAVCPECDAQVRFSRPPMVAQVTVCDGCGEELEVIGINPIILERAPEVEEDWGE